MRKHIPLISPRRMRSTAIGRSVVLHNYIHTNSLLQNHHAILNIQRRIYKGEEERSFEFCTFQREGDRFAITDVSKMAPVPASGLSHLISLLIVVSLFLCVCNRDVSTLYVHNQQALLNIRALCGMLPMS